MPAKIGAPARPVTHDVAAWVTDIGAPYFGKWDDEPPATRGAAPEIQPAKDAAHAEIDARAKAL